MTRSTPTKISPLRLLRPAILLPASLLALAACDSGDNWDNTGDLTAEGRGVYDANADRYNNLQDTGRPTNVNVRDGLFLANQGFRSGRGNPLPARFETNAGVTINTPTPINIEEFSQIVEQITGIRVDYEDLRLVGAFGDGGAGAAQADAAGGIDLGALTAVSRSTTVGPTERTFRVRHTGKLSAVLDTVASRMAADWVYEGGRIVFKGPQTLTYTIWAFPGSSTTEGAVGGGTDVFGSGQAATTSRSSAFDYWTGVEASIRALIPPGVGTFTANSTTGSITVTGNQAIHMRVQDFIENENRRLSRQVAVRIDVVALTANTNNRNSLSLNGIFNSTDAGFQMGVTRGSTGGAGVTLSEGGVTVGAESLAAYGNAAVIQTQTVTAMNNTPTPVSITREQAYVQSVTAAGGDAGGTTITPGIITSGVNFVVTPRIMSSNDVVLQYTLNMSELVDIATFESGGNQVQLPETTSRNLSQVVNLRSGDTVIIGSSDVRSTRMSKEGAFSPSFWGLGGGNERSTDSTRILILMTPVVLEASNTPRTRRP